MAIHLMKLLQGDMVSLAWLILFAYLICRGIYESVTEQGFRRGKAVSYTHLISASTARRRRERRIFFCLYRSERLWRKPATGSSIRPCWQMWTGRI